MAKGIKYLVFLGALLAIHSGGATGARAQDPEKPHEPSPAVWMMPAQTQAPSWLDLRSHSAIPDVPHIVTTGEKTALLRDQNARTWILDLQTQTTKDVALPKDAQWLALRRDGSILVYDGTQILTAPSADAAATVEGFVPVLGISGAKVLDGAEDTLVYADDAALVIVDLMASSMRRVKLTDFFDDEKIAAMTPEAVQKSEEAAAKKKSKKKTSKKTDPDAQGETTVLAEATGVWWRHDGVGVVRVRSLLDVRTFVTTDNGRSWTRSTNAPDKIVHEFGLIWDGERVALSRDGQTWVCTEGKRVSPMDAYVPRHALTVMPLPPKTWSRLDAPLPPQKNITSQNTPDAPLATPAQTEQPQPEPACAELPRISAQPTIAAAMEQNVAGLYAPTPEPTGIRMGLYSNATCLTDADPCPDGFVQPPGAWSIPVGSALAPMDLPEGCIPRYVGSVAGIGVALCEHNPDMVSVYTRSAQTPWTPETQISSAFTQDLRLLVADDGTLVMWGACTQETFQTVDAEGQPVSETADVCPMAVRQPREIGAHPVVTEDEKPTAELWRIERVEYARGVVPVSGGRLLTLEGNGDAQGPVRLTLRSAERTETLVDSFDPSPHHGLVMTQEGCLALYDDGDDLATLRTGDVATHPDAVKLLSRDGHIAELDCAASRTAAELGSTPPPEDEPAGDDRYGIRLGAGGFFTTQDVQTWFMRIEAMIPIYRGQYEIGLMYRMGGGNTSTAMGHLGLASIRWRYDGFEHFDFAVGAGLGYGSMCGYDKKSDSAAMDEDDDTKPSGFAKCSNNSIRYLISALATYKLADHWKIFVGLELLGGSSWGLDFSGGLEVRF